MSTQRTNCLCQPSPTAASILQLAPLVMPALSTVTLQVGREFVDKRVVLARVADEDFGFGALVGEHCRASLVALSPADVRGPAGERQRERKKAEGKGGGRQVTAYSERQCSVASGRRGKAQRAAREARSGVAGVRFFGLRPQNDKVRPNRRDRTREVRVRPTAPAAADTARG